MLFGGALSFGWVLCLLLWVVCRWFALLLAPVCLWYFGIIALFVGYEVCYLCVLYLRLLCVVVDVVVGGLWLRSGFACSWLCVGYCGGFTCLFVLVVWLR